MPISNAELAQQISDLVNKWGLREDEMIGWLAGTVGGGPNLDGTYPLTDVFGAVTTYVACPAQLEADVEGLVNSASTYASDAAASAAAAATSETNAATHETGAQTAQTAAEAAQAIAENARDLAANSASNAATSASNAATSETNAATSEANAAASYDSFDDRYLGAKASNPTLDNDGDPLLTGAIYWNTTSGEWRVYTGSVWTTALTPDSSYAVKANAETITGIWQHNADLHLGNNKSLRTEIAAGGTFPGFFWMDATDKFNIGNASYPTTVLGNWTFNANVYLATRAQFTALGSAPPSGAGLELYYDTTNDWAALVAYDRTGAAYKPLQMAGSTVTLISNGAGNSITMDPGSGRVRIIGDNVGNPCDSNILFTDSAEGNMGYIGFAGGSSDYQIINYATGYASNDLTFRVASDGRIKASVDAGSSYYDIHAKWKMWRAYYSGSLAVSNATWTDVPFDNTAYETGDGTFNTTTGEYTVPTGATVIRITCQVIFDASSAGDRRQLQLLRNTGGGYTSNYFGRPLDSNYIGTATSVTPLGFSVVLRVSGGDKFKAQVYQNTGGNLNVSGGQDSNWMTIEVLESDY